MRLVQFSSLIMALQVCPILLKNPGNCQRGAGWTPATYFFFRFTLYLAYNRVGREQLVSRHSFLRPNFATLHVPESFAAPCLVTRRKKVFFIGNFISYCLIVIFIKGIKLYRVLPVDRKLWIFTARIYSTSSRKNWKLYIYIIYIIHIYLTIHLVLKLVQVRYQMKGIWLSKAWI